MQRRIFADIFSLGVTQTDSTDEEDNQVEVGGDGSMIDKRVLTFKILVFDLQAQNILAPVMKVGNLRDNNVALHLSLNSKRDQIPDMPAIYLICKLHCVTSTCR